MKEFKLLDFYYSPGYCDMNGGSHGTSLRNKDGAWVMECSDREYHSAPRVVAVYEVADDAVKEFERFLAGKRVTSLEKRRNSDHFITDYSPWSISFDYRVKVLGKETRRHCGIYEYRKYTKRDIKLLSELKERFAALKGAKISETTGE